MFLAGSPLLSLPSVEPAPAPPNDQVLIYDLELVEVQGESRSRFHSWHVSSHVEL